MSSSKSDKELAFLYDIYVAPDWSERFAALISEEVKLPEKGRVLYVAAGTGGHALALAEQAEQAVTFACVDESKERLILAQAKAAAINTGNQVKFRQSQLEALDFEDDQFDVVIGDASLIAANRLPEILAEMVRVAAPGGMLAVSLATASSFGEFFSIYWEALCHAGLEEHAHLVETLINELPTASNVEALLARQGLHNVQSATRVEEFTYESGEAFLAAPLTNDFLLSTWLEPLPGETVRVNVAEQITRIINDERENSNFILSIKATIASGRKAAA